LADAPRRACAIVVALAALASVSAAHAHGDPASDILIGANVFLSLESPSQSAEGRVLEALAAAAKERRFPIKIAVVARRSDLGTTTALYGRAQAYADFLGQELRFLYHGTLIVVMGGSPGGVGVYGPGKTDRVRAVAQAVAVPDTTDTKELGEAAAVAIRRVAAAAGHPLPATETERKRTTVDRAIILGAALVLAVVFVIAWPARSRRRG
jgi:hypothetical protein